MRAEIKQRAIRDRIKLQLAMFKLRVIKLEDEKTHFAIQT